MGSTRKHSVNIKNIHLSTDGMGARLRLQWGLKPLKTENLMLRMTEDLQKGANILADRLRIGTSDFVALHEGTARKRAVPPKAGVIFSARDSKPTGAVDDSEELFHLEAFGIPDKTDSLDMALEDVKAIIGKKAEEEKRLAEKRNAIEERKRKLAEEAEEEDLDYLSVPPEPAPVAVMQEEEIEEVPLESVRLRLQLTDQDDTYEVKTEEIELMPEGIPWEDELLLFEISDEERKGAECIPEGIRMWIIPSEDDGIKLGGKYYRVADYPEEGAKSCARTGRYLNIWPDEMTSPEFLERMDIVAREFAEVEWPPNFVQERISDDDMERYFKYLPEDRALFMHPVPDEDTVNEYNLVVLNRFAAFDKATINGRRYYIFRIADLSDWKETVVGMEKTRIVSRKGNEIWVQPRNGRCLFLNEKIFHASRYGDRGPSLPPEGRTLLPYETEVQGLMQTYQEGERYLYPIGEKFKDLPISDLNSLLSIAERQLERGAGIPLVSLKGRWYLAFEYQYPETVRTAYQNGRIKVLGIENNWKGRLQDLKKDLERRRISEAPQAISLPNDPKLRMPYLLRFPEGAGRWALEVDALDAEKIEMKYGENSILKTESPNGEIFFYYISDKKLDHPSAIKIRRVGNDIVVD
ncbi:hypothetical protein JXA56_00745 [Candidatus Micrarchaeota archaeon]|nr:hypothetical protein [Candidatus Micrarchaeota archaeon]